MSVDAIDALYVEIDKALKLPAINLPRKYSRLPRVGHVSNPFKAGTRRTSARVRNALGAHAALLAANQIPGKPFAAAALGAHVGGPAGATAAFSAAEAGSIAATALLGRSIARRKKAASYLSRRSKRTIGVYKSRGFNRFLRTVTRGGKAYKVDAPEPFRTSHKGSGADLLEAAKWSKKTLKRTPRMTRPKKD